MKDARILVAGSGTLAGQALCRRLTIGNIRRLPK